MSSHLKYRFASVLAASLGAGASAQTTLLTDNFNTEASLAANPNADQSGLLAPATYTASNPFGPNFQRRGAGVLELAFDGTNATAGSRVFTDANYVNVANTLNSPIRFTFDINASQVDWVGLVVGTTSAWLDAGGATTEFSALFRNDGTGNKWVNGANLGGLATDTSSLITLELTNTAGTGSPFNGTGSVAKLSRGTTDLGTYTLEQLSATNGRFALCTFNGNLGAGGTVDNFTITATSTATLVPRWSGSVNGNWDETTANFSGQSFGNLKLAGATNVLFGDNDASFNPVATSSVTIAAGGVEIDDVVFDNVSTPYTLAGADANGIKGASNLSKSGGGLLTLSGTHTYTGTTAITGGELVLSGGNNRLPVTTDLTLASPGVLRLNGNHQEVAGLSGNGRVVNGNATTASFTVNNSGSATFSGNLGGTGLDEDNLALIKSGAGTLNLTAPSSFTGGTTIADGVLSLNYEPGGISNTPIGAMDASNTVTINNGGVLTSDGFRNNWLSNTAVSSGGGNAISVVVNPGGTLRGANNRITGLGNVTLNGGTLEVSDGLTGFGWFASFNLGGDLTVGGSTPSSITTSPGAGASANFQLADGANNTSGGGTRTVTVAEVTGNAAPDLLVGARLSNGTLVKEGPGTVEITAGASGTGSPISWEVNDGTFVLANAATFEFRVTNSSSNRVYEGTGSGSAAFNGILDINTAAVTLTNGAIWSLIDVAGLGATFGPNFAVNGFVDPENDGSWTKSDLIGDWTFSEGTGELSLQIADDYLAWGSAYGLAAGSENGDLDGDGLTNFEEYSFGLLPNSGASVNPITAGLDRTGRTFSYTRRDSDLANVNYSVWFSTNLTDWTEDTGATEGTPVLNGDVETVQVTLSNLAGNPLPGRLFVQVRAE